MDTKDIHQTITVKATPHQVYATLVDPGKHAELTGKPVEGGRDVGDTVTSFGGMVESVIKELVPDQKIVWEWRPAAWPKDQYSHVTFTLREVAEGTEVDLLHTDFPPEAYDTFAQGWEQNYWQPLQKMFG